MASSSSSISKLSNEILHQICTLLPIKYIKQFRLVCHQWKTIGDEYFLRDIHIFNETSFMRLLEISRHPNIPLHVRSITYSRITLSKPRLEHLVHIEKKCPRRWTPRKLDKILHWDHNRILAKNRDTNAFRNAIKRFPKLKSINILCGGPIELQLGDYDSDHLSVIDPLGGVRQLGALHKVIPEGKIENLRARYLDCEFFTRSSPMKISRVWSSVTHLDLALMPDSADTLQNGLKLVLQQLVMLRRLSLQFYVYAEPGFPQLESIMDYSSIWPCLTSLTLSGFASTEVGFTNALTLNMSTIEYLGLGNFKLLIGSWIPILTIIRKRALKGVNLHGHLEDQARDWWEDQSPFRQTEKWLVEDYKSKMNCPLHGVI